MNVSVSAQPLAVVLQWQDAQRRLCIWSYCLPPGMPYPLLQFVVVEPCPDCGQYHPRSR